LSNENNKALAQLAGMKNVPRLMPVALIELLTADAFLLVVFDFSFTLKIELPVRCFYRATRNCGLVGKQMGKRLLLRDTYD
jgi:hypothetical protein